MNHGSNFTGRGAGEASASQSSVLALCARRLNILAGMLSDVPVHDRGGVGGGWRGALESLYGAIDACESLNVADALCAVELACSAFRKCDVVSGDNVLGHILGLIKDLNEQAIVDEANRRFRNWILGGGPLVPEAA